MIALDPALVDRFRGDVLAITRVAPSLEARLGIAVSGGADSLALLTLAHAAYPGCIAAATVDHRLRPEAVDEAAFVGSVCRSLGVPHEILVKPDDMIFDGNIPDQARQLRYHLLRFWGGSGTLRNAPPWRVTWIATGHQRDDVAEGFLMRARRGSGLGGLAAMQALRDDLGLRGPPVIRPLLGWSRAELAAIVTSAGLTPVADPTNIDRDYDRARIRQLIAESDDLPADRLALAATNLRDAEDALDWVAAREWLARAEIVAAQTVWLDPVELPYELRRRLVRRALDHLRALFDIADGWRGSGLDRLVAALDRGEHATLAGVAARSGKRWRFRMAPPRRSL